MMGKLNIANKIIAFILCFSIMMSVFPMKIRASTTPKVIDDEYIYLDLYYGDITLSSSGYSGYVLENGEAVQKSGAIDRNIYIYQSNGDSTVWENGLPKYDRVAAPSSAQGTTWGDYITNNTNINNVINNWKTEATNVNRSATGYRISITGGDDYDVTIDNIWSSYHYANSARTTGGLAFYANTSTASTATITLKGDNRFGNVFYATNSYRNHKMIFDSIDDATLTVADFEAGGSANHYNSAIGGTDSAGGDTIGLIFESGIIYAGTTYADNCTAIGAGGNAKGDITINGGTITAVSNSTGVAIGGGIGFSSGGGDAEIEINGGQIYAYNFGYGGIPAAAIGGGSSSASDGNKSTIVTINGGNVYAESVAGTAIGGGSSKTKNGGSATINIGGTAVVTARSVSGKYNGVTLNAGAAIGGGTGGSDSGKNGGNATVNISGNAKVYTGSIGGGKTNNSTGTIGNATVEISGSPIIQGQFIMAAGATNPCSFTMDGGSIDNSDKTNEFIFLQENGGAVYVENGNATMNGGIITGCSTGIDGGAVYVDGGDFTMNDGSITNNTASNEGGAIYVAGGDFTMNGGEISSNESDNEGGAIYVAGGDITMTGGEIANNETGNEGGAIYITGGYLTMTSGTISNNIAANEGGAIYVNEGDVVIGLDTCLGKDEIHSHPEILNNTATNNGGGIAVNGGEITMYCGNLVSNNSQKNQSSNNVLQSGGVFNIDGGNLGIGVLVTGGTFTDLREGTYQVRLHAIYEGVDESIIVYVETNEAYFLPKENEIDNANFSREGLYLIGWSTSPTSTEGYMLVGNKISIPQNTDLYAVWGTEEPIASFIVYIPDELVIDEYGFGSMNINASLKYFTNIAKLDIMIDDIDGLHLNNEDSVNIDYELIDDSTGNILNNGDTVATFTAAELKKKTITAEIIDEAIYAGDYEDVLLFTAEYDDGL